MRRRPRPTIAHEPLEPRMLLAADAPFIAAPLVVTDQAGWQSSAVVRVVDPANGRVVGEIQGFETGFRGGVRAAVGDLDGDSIPEIVVVPGRGRVADIAVFRQVGGSDGSLSFVRDTAFDLTPFGAGYRRGLDVVVADFNGDGRADIAVAQSSGRGEVRVFTTGGDGRPELFRAFTPLPDARTGVSLAAGDFGTFFNGTVVDAGVPDGRAELVVASGPGRSPVVQIHDLSSAAAPVLDTIRPFGADAGFRGGMTVTVGRLNHDSIPDVVVAQGRGGTGRVEIYDGRVASPDNLSLAAFAAFPTAARGNPTVFAALTDTTRDGRGDALTVARGVPGRTDVRRFTVTPTNLGSALTVQPQATLPAATFGGRLAAAVIGVPAGLVTTTSGLQYRDVVVGAGATPSSSLATVTVNYEGRLLDGTRFDGREGMTFQLNRVIAGWTEGVGSMRVGGRRQLIVPPSLGYGESGTDAIPPNATLVFDVELLATT
jgi:hypothetical protein